MTGQALVLRGDARALPLPDESVDLIVTSPPYWSLRAYTDGGEHYQGQIGSEDTPAEYIATLLECTAEWVRVLKPTGSLFVDLGDKYSDRGHGHGLNRGHGTSRGPQATHLSQTRGPMEKSLLLLPERYRIGCVDRLGLIARAVLVWHKVNGLPESVTDRVRRSHEDWIHLTKRPHYYSAVDEIREPTHRIGLTWEERKATGARTIPVVDRAGQRGHMLGGPGMAANPLGKLPGSVWEIPSEPLRVPDHLGVDHFAAFPSEWPRQLILGWSPPGICVGCGEGRRPVVSRHLDTSERPNGYTRARGTQDASDDGSRPNGSAFGMGPSQRGRTVATVGGYACACAPRTDHPAEGSTTRRGYSPGLRDNNAQGTYGRHQAGEYERVGPWREYHLDRWTPPPTRPAVVLDPFAGTGTTMLAAKALGRIGVGVDRSGDYCRLAAWRTTDPAELAKAMRVPKPPTELEGQGSLFDALEVTDV